MHFTEDAARSLQGMSKTGSLLQSKRTHTHTHTKIYINRDSDSEISHFIYTKK